MGRKIKSNSDQASFSLSVQAVDEWDRVCQNPGHHEARAPSPRHRLPELRCIPAAHRVVLHRWPASRRPDRGSHRFHKFRSEYPHHGADASGISRRRAVRDASGNRCARLLAAGQGGDAATLPGRLIRGGGRAAPSRWGRAAPGCLRAVRAAKRLLPSGSRPRCRRDLPPHAAHPDSSPLPRVLK
jgi:hypothetical protein